MNVLQRFKPLQRRTFLGRWHSEGIDPYSWRRGGPYDRPAVMRYRLTHRNLMMYTTYNNMND